MTSYTFISGKNIQNNDNPEIVISDSYVDSVSIQNATRLRFQEGLIENIDSKTLVARMRAVHKRTNKVIDLSITVTNE